MTRATTSVRIGDDGQAAWHRALLWLNCRLGEWVNVEVGGAWALEACGELRHWRGVAGLYRIGDVGLLDLNGLGEADRVSEGGVYPNADQMVLEFENGLMLTVTIEGPAD